MIRRRRTARSYLLELALIAGLIGVFYLLLATGVMAEIARAFGEYVQQNFRPQPPNVLPPGQTP